jgi:hypothetical protein
MRLPVVAHYSDVLMGEILSAMPGCSAVVAAHTEVLARCC